MKFDPYAFAEQCGIEAGARAIHATCANSAAQNSTNSANSRGQAPDPENPPTSPPSARDNDFRHRVCRFTGKPRTWTGRVVSLDAWRELSEWERHGSTGKIWNGLTRQWEHIEGGRHGK